MPRHESLAKKLSLRRDRWRSKKGRRRLLRNLVYRIRKISFWVFIGVICAIGVQIPVFLLKSPHFFIDTIKVDVKSGYITEQEVVDRLKEFFQKEYSTVHPNIFRIDLEKATEFIALYPKVRKVILKRRLPRKILVEIEGREPRLKLQVLSKYYGVDDQKVIFPVSEKLRLPLVVGIDKVNVGSIIRHQGIEDVFLIYKTIDELGINLRDEIVKVNISNPRCVILVVKGINPILVYVGSRLEKRKLAQRLRELEVVLEYFKTDTRQREYIDLRFDNIIIK